MSRGLWSPSRVKAALQCGRKLQGMEAGWSRTEHVRGIRGRAVHRAVEKWEDSERALPLPHLLTNAWEEILAESTSDSFDHVQLTDLLFQLWNVEAEIRLEEDVVAEKLSDRYKRPRQTKAFAQDTAFLEDARSAARVERAEIEKLTRIASWPWEYDERRGILDEGFDHSLETVRKGTEYITGLWPEPDIVGAEWDLQSTLPNGYRIHGFIDRVEMTTDGVEIVDYKSSKFQDTDLDHFLQVATYSILAEDHMGFAPTRARLLYLRDQDSALFEVQPGWRDSLSVLVESADRVLASEAFSPSFAGCGICPWFSGVCAPEFALVPTGGEDNSS